MDKLIADESKILILGYKTKGRGENVTPHLKEIRENISRLLDINKGIISFDNNALEQLDIKNLIDSDIWEKHFMGDEGQFSMYLDTVHKKYYVSSTHEEGFAIQDLSLEKIFGHIQKIR